MVATKFGSVALSSCHNLNPDQDRDQDQDHNFTLQFDTKSTFYTYKTPIKFCLDALTPSKVIMYPNGRHRRPNVRLYIHIDRQTDGQTARQASGIFFCSFSVL